MESLQIAQTKCYMFPSEVQTMSPTGNLRSETTSLAITNLNAPLIQDVNGKDAPT